MASVDTSQSRPLGTQKNVQHGTNSLVAIYEELYYVLRTGEAEGLHKFTVRGKIPPSSSACWTGDGILITGGQLNNEQTKQCRKLSLPTRTWSNVADLSMPRDLHASVCVGGQAYVLGGWGTMGRRKDTP